MDKISLAGDLGSGKSTVSKLLMARLGYDYYSTGTTFRAMAAERGMTVVEFNEYLEKYPETDKEIDGRLVALSDDPRGLIIDSRMAFHFVKDTFRIYFSTELEVSAARILGDHRAEESFGTVEETAANILRRKESERKRYLDFYGVDCKDLAQYSLVVDTTYATPEQVADCVCDCFDVWKDNHDMHICFLSPFRPLYPDTLDIERAHTLSYALERHEELPLVTVHEDGGRFYVTGEPEVAVAYALTDATLFPCRIAKGKPPAGDYVRMGDSL